MLPALIEGDLIETKLDGLSADRRWYLFKEVQQFCDDKDRDAVDPKPVEPVQSLGAYITRHRVPLLFCQEWPSLILNTV